MLCDLNAIMTLFSRFNEEGGLGNLHVLLVAETLLARGWWWERRQVFVQGTVYCFYNRPQLRLACFQGVNKHLLEDVKGHYRRAFEESASQTVVNRGFRSHENGVFSYSQEKIGFGFVNVKRQVQPNRINTKPLDIWLEPIIKTRLDDHEVDLDKTILYYNQ